MNKIMNLLNVFSKEKPTELSPLKSPVDQPVAQKMPTKEQIIQDFEEWALSFAGMSEAGGNTNRADYIDPFNVCTRQPLGSPYCVSAYQFRRRQLEDQYNITFDLPFTAGSQFFWSQTKSEYRFSEPKKGRFAVFRSALDSSKGHLALCLSDRLADGTFNTFEFNTSGNGSRNGMYQMRKTRKIGANGSLILLGFADYSIAYRLKS